MKKLSLIFTILMLISFIVCIYNIQFTWNVYKIFLISFLSLIGFSAIVINFVINKNKFQENNHSHIFWDDDDFYPHEEF